MSAVVYLENPHRGAPEVLPVPAGTAGLLAGAPGAAPTELRSMPSVAAAVGVAQLWVKDETSRCGLPSFKVMGALSGVRAALAPKAASFVELEAAARALRPLRLVAATDGNHGHAVAQIARWLGLNAHILVPDDMLPGRVARIASAGASVEVVDGDYDEAVRRSATYEAVEGHRVVSDTSWAGYTAVPTAVIAGYAAIFAEVSAQLGGASPTAVVVPFGVGALAAAAVAHWHPRGIDVFAVEPVSAACGQAAAAAGRPVSVPGPHASVMSGLNCGEVSPLAWRVNGPGLRGFVALSDDEALAGVALLAGDGLLGGECSGAGPAAVSVLRDHGVLAADARVLCVATEAPLDTTIT